MPRAKKTAFASLPSRPEADFEPEDIRVAFQSADSGNMMPLADLCEDILSDYQVSGVLGASIFGVLGLKTQFEGSEDLIALLESGGFDRLHPPAELLRFMSWSLLMGVGLGRRKPEPSRHIGDLEYPSLESWNPRWMRTVPPNTLDHKRRWFVQTTAGEREVQAGNGEWILWFPFGGDRPWASSLVRSLAGPWVIKRFSMMDRSRHSEVLGSPIRIGKAPQGATERQRQRWRSQIANLSRDGVIILPEGFEFDVLEADGRTWEIYSDQISWADKAIATAINGQSVTTEGTTGFSGGGVQQDVYMDVQRYRAKSLSIVLTSQSLKPWCEQNFPKSSVSLTIVTEPAEDANERGKALSSLGTAITDMDKALSSSGQRVDAGQLLGSFGVSLVSIGTPDKAPATPDNLGENTLEAVITVEEARAAAGLGPLLDPNGERSANNDLTVAAFRGKSETSNVGSGSPETIT